MITKDAPEDPAAPRDIVAGPGEMAARIRGHDWAGTPLGAMETWSPSLKMMLRFLLANRFPLLLWWGPRFCQLYNDPYRPVLGSKHPNSLGQPAAECWPEIWDIIGPLIETPFQGGPPTWMEDIALEPLRHGFVEETHFTIAYSPVPDETVESGIGGVLATVHEITEKVVGERRVVALRDLGARAVEGKSTEDACEAAAETFSRHPKDVPFALIYLIDPDRKCARLAAVSGLTMGEAASPRTVELEGEAGDSAIWPLGEVVRREASCILDDLAARFPGAVPPGPWSDPPRQAVVLPIRSNLAHQLAGMLVVGVSARLKLEDSYKSFLELAASQIATAISNARAYEEERKRAEALAEIDRAKTTFFSNVSHEFRTPLTLLLGPLEEALAKAEGATLPGSRDLVEVAHRNGLRLLKLVNALLDYSRIEAGRTKLSLETEDLPVLTKEYASMFRSAMEKAGLEYRVECETLPNPVRVDRDAWEKIVLNLVSNAFKYTFEGHVVVSMRAEGDRAVLTVTDTGIGIPSHELPNLFKRFHRVEGAHGRTYEGTGIGLSLVRELVHLHGGKISVRSEAGRGTTFRVELPQSSETASHSAPSGGPRATAGQGARAFVEEALRWLPDASPGYPDREPSTMFSGRVLLADDNADVRQYIRGLLEPAGYSVEAVSNGEEALVAARRERPDLILTDVMMPVMDGFALLAAVRLDPSLSEIPVVMLSARAGEESKVEGLERGADDYLVKPFSARELVARVASNLSLARFRKESAERVTSILESLNDAFQTIDANGRYSYINGTMKRILTDQGVDPDSIIGKHVFEAFPESRDTEIGKSFLKAKQERTYVEIEAEYAPFGRWYAIRFHPNRDGGVSILSEDITARKRAEEELRQRTEERQHLLDSERAARMEAERLGRVKDEFLATLSHELRTPINAILGWARLVRKDSENRELRDKALEVIERNSHAQTQLISDLLDMSRVISGKLRLEFDQVDLPLVIEASVESLRPTAEARGVKLRTVIGPVRGAVHGDAERLQQVVWNLISNAIKFTEAGGWAEVELADAITGVEISVRDCGKGIRPEFLPHLFERFRQEDSSAAREHGGLGIGLALVKQLVDLHGGLVYARSDGEGHGATFTVILPYVHSRRRADMDEVEALKTWPKGDMPTLKGIKVLVVDDEEDARELLKRLLEEHEAEVLVAASAEEAMEFLLREDPQVLLSDVGMPGRDGYEFIREVRAAGSMIPAAALTAFARSEDRTRALLSGFQSHVAKPFEPAELLVTVAALAGKMSTKP